MSGKGRNNHPHGPEGLVFGQLGLPPVISDTKKTKKRKAPPLVAKVPVKKSRKAVELPFREAEKPRATDSAAVNPALRDRRQSSGGNDSDAVQESELTVNTAGHGHADKDNGSSGEEETAVNVEGESIRMHEVSAAGLSDEMIFDLSLAAVASIPMEEEGLSLEGKDTLGEEMESDRLCLPESELAIEEGQLGDGGYSKKRATKSKPTKAATAPKRKLRSQQAVPHFSGLEDIKPPSFDSICKQSLQRLGFRFIDKKWLLPEHSSPHNDSGFESIKSLRQHLCRHGIPLPPEMDVRNILTDDEATILARWVRYHIATPVLEKSIIPCQEIGRAEAERILETLGLTFDEGHYKIPDNWIPEEVNSRGLHRKWSHVEAFLTRFGVPDHVIRNEHVSTMEEKRKCLLYLTENIGVTTFVSCRTPAPPAEDKAKKVKQERKPRELKQSIVPSFEAREELDLNWPPEKCEKTYSRKKSLFAQSFIVLPGEVTRSTLLDGSTVDRTWQTLGSIRNSTGCHFKWGNYIGWRWKIGRAYFDSFTLEGKKWRVGEFVWIKEGTFNEELYRIISAFQATNSFIGRWVNPDDELQKRGKVYIEVVPLAYSKNKDNTVILCETENGHQGYVDALCRRIFDGDLAFVRRASVDVLEHAPIDQNQASLVCWQAKGKRRCEPLTEEQYSLLTSSAEQLAHNHAACNWPAKCQAKQVQMVSEAHRSKGTTLNPNRMVRETMDSIEPPMRETIDSSDDSDAFDEESLRTLEPINDANLIPERTLIEERNRMLLKQFEPPKSNLSMALPQIVFKGSPIEKRKEDSEREREKDRESVDEVAKLCREHTALHRFIHPSAVSARRKELAQLSEHFTIVTEPNEMSCASKVQHDTVIRRLKELGHKQFRGLQEAVCQAAIYGSDDVIFLAPCGLGKSVCFQIPALEEKGITLVIEPLNTLIMDQLEKHKKYSNVLETEKLLSFDDNAQGNKYRAWDRLQQILNEYYLISTQPGNTTIPKSHIIFGTPELVDACLPKIEELSDAGWLTRVVFDEFDYTNSCNRTFRSKYPELLPKLKERCKGSKFMFLSGTTTDDALRHLLIESPLSTQQRKPNLFLSHRVVSESLSFRVERKETNEQVAKRICHILHAYSKEKPDEKKPKCLCYCLKLDSCEKMKNFLAANGVIAEVITRPVTQETGEMERIMMNFRLGRTQVLCVTSVLGRGYHVDDVRFVFHSSLPLSLANYIQETGRAGRDGKTAYAYLFYRAQDHTSVEQIRTDKVNRNEAVTNATRTENEEMMQYCSRGDLCRYSLLHSHVTMPLSCESEMQMCHKHARCDICESSRYQEVDFTLPLTSFLLEFATKASPPNNMLKEPDVDSLLKHVLHKSVADSPNLSLLLKAGGDSKKGTQTSLRDDLLRRLTWLNVLMANSKFKEFGKDRNFKYVLSQLKRGEVRFMLKIADNTSGPFWTSDASENGSDQEDPLSRQRGSRVFDFEEVPVENANNLDDRGTYPKQQEYDYVRSLLGISDSSSIRLERLSPLPFLIQFEMLRMLSKQQVQEKLKDRDICAKLDQLLDDTWKCMSRYQACEWIHQVLDSMHEMRQYRALTLEEPSGRPPLDERNGSELFFSASMDSKSVSPRLILHPPEKAIDRRVFREFGSHRFLHVNVATDVDKRVVTRFLLENKNWLAGRRYAFLWCKETKSPQCFVLFAEEGVGINRLISVDEVRDWCIPLKLNPEITLEKHHKRMKLSFSKTTPSGRLPAQCLEMICDIINKDDNGNDGDEMTDGCGLISGEALDYIWKEYARTHSNDREENEGCPFTSFQGRIGSFKGVWVLDKSLDGIRIQCRKSQQKYSVPMQSLKNPENGDLDIEMKVNDAYDTVDVCSWDEKPENGFLNIRLVQILEERGVELDTLLSFVNDGLKWIEDMRADPAALFDHLKKRQAAIVKQDRDEESHDTKLLFRMEGVNCNKNEPVYSKKLNAVIHKEADRMKRKARYPVRNCCYLRLIPDHTCLLEEGETYVAVGPECTHSLSKASHILAMRSPSYFAGDLRKLKLIDLDTLEERAQQTSYDGRTLHRFFRNLRYGLVLSTKGLKSEAQKMSGGDFDGDKAWVCWNPKLVDHVKDLEAEDTATKDFAIRKSAPGENEQRLHALASQENRVKFSLHKRKHQHQLGRLSNLLDKTIDIHGLRDIHGLAKAVGTQGFLQVDHPYYLCELQAAVKEILDRDPKEPPHWAPTSTNSGYRSSKALGRMWDHVENKIQAMTQAPGSGNSQANEHIIAVVENAREKDAILVEALQVRMRAALKVYAQEMRTLVNRLKATVCSEEERKKRTLNWISKYCREQYTKLIQSESGVDGRNLAAAVLYEESLTKARLYDGELQVTPFAWQVAYDLLSRIIGDAENGNGRLAVTRIDSNDRRCVGRKLRR